MMRKKLQEIVGSDLVSVSPDTLVGEVMKLMREKSFSCMPVLEDGRPVGIFTERHMVKLLAENGGRFGDKPISELMAAPVITAHKDLYVHEAFHILEKHGIRHLVVIDDQEKAVGILTHSNLMDQIGEDFFVEFQPVSKLMSRSTQTAAPDEALGDVLVKMARLKISCVICAENDRPLGVLTERDMVRLLESGKNIRELTLGRAMNSPAVTIDPDTEIHQAVKIMRAKGIRRLVVTDSEGRITGMVTQTNLVRGLESKYVKILRELLEDRETRLESTTREREELSLYLECILDTSMDMGIVGADTELNVIYCNEAASRVLGEPSREALGRKIVDLHEMFGVPSESFGRILEKVEEQGSYTYTWNRTRDNEERYFQARVAGVWDRNRNLVGYVNMVQDITERKKAEENIRYMAYHDILTGLPNRVAFDERLSLEMARAERNKLILGIMVVDLDRFKEVNDTMGHFAGDLLLQEASARMQSCLRKSDTLARYGGDEFIIVLPEIEGPEDAELVAQKLAKAMEEPVEIKGDPYKAGISMGIALYPMHSEHRVKLIEIADQAMYRAKSAGRESGRSHYVLADAEEIAETG